MSTTKSYVCKFGLRPRINGKAVSIAIGKPFEKSVIDTGTFEAFLKAGHISVYQEKVADAVFSEEKPAMGIAEHAEPKILAETGSSDTEKMEQIRKKALEEFGVELNQRKLETIEKAYDKLVKEASDKPSGVFNLKIVDLADKDLDELDATHSELCSENGLDAPEPFESIEAAIEKLTSEG